MKTIQDLVCAVYKECFKAIKNGEEIERISASDKEFSFSNWFLKQLQKLKIEIEDPSRNAYPDFKVSGKPVGFEVKGLGFPGREKNYDCNSQVPSGLHDGSEIYYVFGRYPAEVKGKTYPVLDFVLCHGDLLNSDHEYVHENKNLKGFGSYGDIMIRDRKMYVAPTPYYLLKNVASEITLILKNKGEEISGLTKIGHLKRTAVDSLIRGYEFDMNTNTLTGKKIKNSKAGSGFEFYAYTASRSGKTVSMAV